jgi:hypothetical protein
VRYRALHRRLDEIEVKLDAIERQNTRMEQERTFSKEELAKQAEETYRRIMAPKPRPEGSRKSLEETMAEYFRLVRGSAPLPGKKRR